MCKRREGGREDGGRGGRRQGAGSRSERMARLLRPPATRPLHPSPPPAPFSLLLFFLFPVGVPRKRRRADRPPSRARVGFRWGRADRPTPRAKKAKRRRARSAAVPSRVGGGRSRERKRERRRAVPSARIGDRPICSVARGGPFSLSFWALPREKEEKEKKKKEKRGDVLRACDAVAGLKLEMQTEVIRVEGLGLRV